MNNLATIESEKNQVIAITPMTMLQMAVQQGADLEKLKQLMDLQERWEKNEARKAYNQAFSNFKAEAVKVIKSTTVKLGPLAGTKYADLFSVVEAATPALSKHGLSASWRLTKDEKDWIEVTCTITHVLGHSESTALGGPPDTGGAKNPIQARASTVNYLERYSLLAATGLAAQGQDTDGNAPKSTAEPDETGKKTLEACGSDAALKKAWAALTEEQRKTLNGVMADCKRRIREADGVSA